MAGRGRGRGRGKGLSFNVESLGFGRGESLPTNVLEPPPAYPPLEVKAVPLATGDHYNYLLALKQEYRANMKESIYYIKPDEKRKDIERYSDKYQEKQQATKQGCIVWSSLPKELQPRPTKRKAARGKKAKSKDVPADIVQKLEELEKKEGSEAAEEEEPEAEEDEGETEAKKKKTEEDDDEEDIEEDIDEEELEDETDYAMTYFDNGEGFGVDEDDDLEDNEGALY